MTHSPTPPETQVGDTANPAPESTDARSSEGNDSTGATNDERGDGAKDDAQSDATSVQDDPR